MLNENKILAIIPARAGSTRISQKNTKVFAGKPLVSWTIEAAKRSKYIDRIIISTNDDLVIKIAKEYKINVSFKRPENLSGNNAASEKVVMHTIKKIEEKENHKYDYCILLQSTSPLRTTDQIDEALEKIVNNKKAKSLVSVGTFEKSPYWIKKISSSGFLQNFIKEKDCERKAKNNKLYMPNGAIYIAPVEIIKKEMNFYTDKTIYYIMDEISSIDIDTEFDFKLAEHFFKNYLCIK